MARPSWAVSSFRNILFVVGLLLVAGRMYSLHGDEAVQGDDAVPSDAGWAKRHATRGGGKLAAHSIILDGQAVKVVDGAVQVEFG